MCITVLVIVPGFFLASSPRAMLKQPSNAIMEALYIANDIFMVLSRLRLLVGFDNLSGLLLFATSLPLNTVFKLRYGSELVWKALRASRFFCLNAPNNMEPFYHYTTYHHTVRRRATQIVLDDDIIHSGIETRSQSFAWGTWHHVVARFLISFSSGF
jgi:hypothetical protein